MSTTRCLPSIGTWASFGKEQNLFRPPLDTTEYCGQNDVKGPPSVRISFVLIGTRPAATRIVSRGGKREGPGNEVRREQGRRHHHPLKDPEKNIYNYKPIQLVSQAITSRIIRVQHPRYNHALHMQSS